MLSLWRWRMVACITRRNQFWWESEWDWEWEGEWGSVE
jgi:hypothetical protein